LIRVHRLVPDAGWRKMNGWEKLELDELARAKRRIHPFDAKDSEVFPARRSPGTV